MIQMLGRLRQARAIDAGDSVVDLFATELEGETEHGTYIVQRVGEGWAAKFRPVGARLDQRSLAIDAQDAVGESQDWASRGCASAAVSLHAHLMALGHGAIRASELVAERSRQLHREWLERRPVVLDYAQQVRS
jgi:hypothetical protein